MDLSQFFGTARELNQMVDWKPDAPVDEFWEAWNNAAQEVAALQSENDALRAQLADMKLKYNTLQVEFAALSSAAGHMEAAYEAALAAASS